MSTHGRLPFVGQEGVFREIYENAAGVRLEHRRK
jgi:hypothetical protein